MTIFQMINNIYNGKMEVLIISGEKIQMTDIYRDERPI